MIKLGYRQYGNHAFYLLVQLPDQSIHQIGTPFNFRKHVLEKLVTLGVDLRALKQIEGTGDYV